MAYNIEHQTIEFATDVLLSGRGLYTQPVQYDQGKASAAAQKRNPAKGRAGETSMRSPGAARMGNPKRIRDRQYRQEGSADRMEKTMVSRAD